MFRSRLSRSRSKGRVIETAFVSKTQSSTEDLDEIDRLANHPVLRPSPIDGWGSVHKLRKSRSEMGGSIDRGLVPYSGSSNQSSPMGGASSFGSRTVGVAMLKGPMRRKKPISRMKRSYTVDFAAAQAADSPENLPVPDRPQKMIEDDEEEEEEHRPRPQINDTPSPFEEVEPPVSHHLVEAVIETSPRPRDCFTPPANLHLLAKGTSSSKSNSGSSSNNNNNNNNNNSDQILPADNDDVAVGGGAQNEATPPNTAPLPTKFGGRHAHQPPPHNLLKIQLNRQHRLQHQLIMANANIEADETSSAASTVDIPTTNKPEVEAATSREAPVPAPRFKLSLSIGQRLRKPEVHGDDSSSADSTPQRRKSSGQPPTSKTSRFPVASSSNTVDSFHGIIATSTASEADTKPMPSTRQRPSAPLLSRKMIGGGTGSATAATTSGSVGANPNPKSSSKIIMKKVLPPRPKGPASRFFANLSGESESCSSAMSSMESVRSSNSDSVQSLVSSSESGAGCSMSSSQSNSDLSAQNPNSAMMTKPTLELRTHRSNILSSSKFQVLSPISDKSQEQSSEQGDSSNSKTPKVSPTDHILTSCCGGMPDDSENNNSANGNGNGNSIRNNVNVNVVVHHTSVESDPAPFAMPKLQRRLIQQQQRQQRHTNLISNKKNSFEGIQGSDSGISMSSQDVQDMVELLQLPFDMPKLRRKTQHILARPQSMPTTEQDQNKPNRKQPDLLDFRSSEGNVGPEGWPGPGGPDNAPAGSTMSALNMDNYQYQQQQQQPPQATQTYLETRLDDPDNSQWLTTASQNKTASGTISDEDESYASDIANVSNVGCGKSSAKSIIPPPPPGFADENNQFYLTEPVQDSPQVTGN